MFLSDKITNTGNVKYSLCIFDILSRKIEIKAERLFFIWIYVIKSKDCQVTGGYNVINKMKEEDFMTGSKIQKTMKRLTAIALAASMGTALAAGCGNAQGDTRTNTGGAVDSAAAEETASEAQAAPEEGTENAAESEKDVSLEDTAHIVVAYPTNGTVPKDLEMVQDAINEITIPEIHTEVALETVEIGSYAQQMNLKMSSGEQLDCMLTFPGGSAAFASVTSQGVFMPLDELLDEYGQELKATVGDDILKATAYGGEICGIPAYYDVAESVIWYMRKDLLEKYGLTQQAQSVKSFEDMEAVLTVIAENEPSISPITNPYIGGAIITTSDYYFLDGFDQPTRFDRLGDNTLQFAVVDVDNDPETVLNAYASDEYMETIKIVRDWYNKGLVYKDASITQEGGSALMKAGTVFSYFTVGNPTQLATVESAAGYDLVQVEIAPVTLSAMSFKNFVWGITQNSAEPEAAMKFLNMLYTDERIVILLNYGIEDVHYVDNGDGTISFPEGVTQENTGYYTFTYWFFGNGFIRKVWEGNDPNLLAEREQVLKETPTSPLMDFSFDGSEYSMETTQITNVINQYRPGIESGTVDSKTEIPKFLEALSAAGGDKYLAAYQEQLDAYYAEKE